MGNKYFQLYSLAICNCAGLLSAVPCELLAVQWYAPASLLPTSARANREVPPLEVTVIWADGIKAVPFRLQVKVGGGLASAEQEMLAVPPSVVKVSAGC